MNVDYDVDGSWVFARCVVAALQPTIESSSTSDSRCIGSPVIIFNALPPVRRATFRGRRIGHPRPGDGSVLLQDIPKPCESGAYQRRSFLRYLATLFSLIRSFHFPVTGYKASPRDGVAATAAVRTYTVRVRVRELHGDVLQTVAHERCRWQVITL